MVLFTATWCCNCGHEWECSRQDFAIGAVVECEKCRQIWANVRRRSGDAKWVPLDRAMAESPYYDLLSPLIEEPTP